MHSAYLGGGKYLGIKSCRTFGIIKPKADGVFCDSWYVVRRLGVELAGFEPEQTLPLTESDILFMCSNSDLI